MKLRMRVCIWMMGLFVTSIVLAQISHLNADESNQSLSLENSSLWDTVEVKSLKLSPEKFSNSLKVKSDPKLESHLDRLWETHQVEGYLGVQTFSKSHGTVIEGDMVQVVIVTSDEAMAVVQEAVKAVGGENQLRYKDQLQALIPISELKAFAGRPDVQIIREPQRAILLEERLSPIPMLGNETTEGLAAAESSAWHAQGINGRGVRVAVIDGGFTGYSALLGTDLPNSVSIYDWSGRGIEGSRHGTACAETIYDMAPGVRMDLHKISTTVELGNAVDQAIADGVDIISASIGFTLDGPGDGTGYISDIVKKARENGILYTAAAGNHAMNCWSGTYSPSPDDSNIHEWAPGEPINWIGPGPNLVYNLPAGVRIFFALHWNDWTDVDQDYNLYLFYYDGVNLQLADYSQNWQNGSPGQMPTEYIYHETQFEGFYGVVVFRDNSNRDVCLRLILGTQGLTLSRQVAQRSICFPGDSPFAFTVGAVNSAPPYAMESYSSRGPTFGPGGSCSGGSFKPDIAGYANVSTVTYGPGGFNGTSASTPHVAGAAALVRQAYPRCSVACLQRSLMTNAVDLGIAGKDNLYGAGRLYLGSPTDYVKRYYIPAIPLLLLED